MTTIVQEFTVEGSSDYKDTNLLTDDDNIVKDVQLL